MCQFIMMIIKPDLFWQVPKPLPFSSAPMPPPVNDEQAYDCEVRFVGAEGYQHYWVGKTNLGTSAALKLHAGPNKLGESPAVGAAVLGI